MCLFCSDLTQNKLIYFQMHYGCSYISFNTIAVFILNFYPNTKEQISAFVPIFAP